jgi:hypothetical protein
MIGEIAIEHRGKVMAMVNTQAATKKKCGEQPQQRGHGDGQYPGYWCQQHAQKQISGQEIDI